MAKCAVMRKYTFLSLFSINSYFETEPDIQSIIQPDVQDAAKKTLEMLLSILNLDLIRKDIEFSHIYKEIPCTIYFSSLSYFKGNSLHKAFCNNHVPH